MEIDTFMSNEGSREYRHVSNVRVYMYTFFDISSVYEDLEFNKLCKYVKDCYIKIGFKGFWKSNTTMQ